MGGQFTGSLQFGGFTGIGFAVTQVNLTQAGQIHFDTTVAVGGGGIHIIDTDGITTLTDAGAAGHPVLSYNPTTNVSYFGNPAGYGLVCSPAVGLNVGNLNAGTTTAYLTAALYQIVGTVNRQIVDALGTQCEGWVFGKGVTIMDDDFQSVSWGATGTVGAKWLSTIGAGGSIARVNPARGGIITLNAATGTTTWMSQDAILQVEMQDAWRLYSRWQVAEVVTTSAIVGIGDTALVNPTDGVAWVVDTAVGANYYLRGTRNTVVVNKDSTIAVDNAFHVFELVSTAAGVVTGYIDTVARGGGLTALQCPVVTINMQPVINSTPLAAPDANLSIDVYKLVLSRYTGVGPI